MNWIYFTENTCVIWPVFERKINALLRRALFLIKIKFARNGFYHQMINLLFLHFPWQCLSESWKCEWDLASCQSVTKNYDFFVPKTHGCGNDYSSFHWQKSCKNIKLLYLWSWWWVLLVAQHVNCCVIQSGVFGAMDHYTGKLEKQNTSLLLT